MQTFLSRHEGSVTGTLSGFDRIVFRGSLRSIAYVQGLDKFLGWKRVLYKDFGAWAEGCTRRLVAHAEKLAEEAGRPYRYLPSSGERKDKLAEAIARQGGIKSGLICVLATIEPCQSFDIHRSRERKRLELVRRERRCRHLYFYLMDPDFGLIHVRLQTWLPFAVQVYVNGRSYLARQMDKAGISYRQHDNAFAEISDPAKAQGLMDRLEHWPWARTFDRLVRPVQPLLGKELRGLKGYYWSVRQAEYATDVVFRDAASLQKIYPSLLEHAFLRFHSDDVMRFLGQKLHGHFKGEVTTDVKRRPEGVRVKHWVRENSLKMYDKGFRILRIETTVAQPSRFKALRKDSRGRLGWKPMRKGVCDFARLAEVSRQANARYLEALSVVGTTVPSYRILDPVCFPVRKDGQRSRALRPVSPDEAQFLAILFRGEHRLHGFRNRDLQPFLYRTDPVDPRESHRRASALSRRLRLLRSHGLIAKVPHQRLYRLTPRGESVIATALAFRSDHLALLAS